MVLEDVGPEVVSPHHESQNPFDSAANCLDTVIALYDFPGTQPSHLPLDLGDTVYVLAKTEAGWWDGVLLHDDGSVDRGWFPENYVRSVNYVQPVLNKLQSNKELDSITAANTAANVLMPSFASLLQKSLAEPQKDSSSNTRKNSVVSFASSETSFPSDPKGRKSDPPSTIDVTQTPPPTHNYSVASTVSMGPHSGTVSVGSSFSYVQSGGESADKIAFTPVEEAEAMVAAAKEKDQKNVVWIPRLADSGELVFYCEYLDIYCEVLPLSPLDPEIDCVGDHSEVPSSSAIDNVRVMLKQYPIEYYTPMDTQSATSSISKSYDGSKRGSSASTTSQMSASSYHNFGQPLFITPGLFYTQFTDIKHWTDLKDHFNQLLDLTWKAIKESNKQLFSMYLSNLTKLVSIVLSASRLVQFDFSDTKQERSVRHKLKKVSQAFAQNYINSLLHLSYMHHSEVPMSTTDYSHLNIHSLNKSTSPMSTHHHSYSSRGSESTFTGANSESGSRTHSLAGEEPSVTYLQQIDDDINVLRHKMNSLIKLFLKLSKDKKVHIRDYDSSDISDDEGEERYNILPQVYPRFISREFNGGNWCNPFFTNGHVFLNLSGEHLKTKYHLKVLLDSYALERVEAHCDDIRKDTSTILEFLNPEAQHKYYNEELRSERNEQVLRVMYKYLHHASELIDLLESLDFTVFSLIQRFQTEGGDSDNSPGGNLTLDYPVVLEFFQMKQYFHHLLAKIIMHSQALTLDDTDAFSNMKEDDSVLYAREAMKDPLEKSAMLLSNILSNQLKRRTDDRITFNQDLTLSELLQDGSTFTTNVVSIVKQLIEERDTILNYSTRVMHDNFNVDILVAERNNTSAGNKTEDSGGQYFGGTKKNSNTPWYLEGDEEFDLLLDMNGSIKGGTKEALIAHLTHHNSHDDPFNTAFLIALPTMFTFGELIHLLIARFNIEAPEGLSYEEYLTWTEKKQNPIKNKVLDVMNSILESYWCSSYNNKTVLQRWLQFLTQPDVMSLPLAKEVAEGVRNIQRGQFPTIETHTMTLPGKAPAPLTKGFSLRKMKLLDIEYVELARQLTLREFELYHSISKLSCIHKVWGKKSGMNESIAEITNFIKASNQLTNFVAYMILRKEDPRKRVQVIRYFVLVAEKCRQYNNFSSMTAIISALYSSPIHRLKKTWSFVTNDAINNLQNMNKLMNSSRNFNEYRDMLKFIGSEPCVPFFGVYLSDLTFVFHGNPDFLMNRTRMVNFSKRSKTVDIVMGIDRFKRIRYNFQHVPEIQTYIDLWFDKCPTIEEQYQLSLNIEPREEKRRTRMSTNAGRAPAV